MIVYPPSRPPFLASFSSTNATQHEYCVMLCCHRFVVSFFPFFPCVTNHRGGGKQNIIGACLTGTGKGYWSGKGGESANKIDLSLSLSPFFFMKTAIHKGYMHITSFFPQIFQGANQKNVTLGSISSSWDLCRRVSDGLLLVFLMKILYVFHANDNVNQSLSGDGHRC